MSLQQQIQQEMEQEARIDKAIDSFVKRFLKQNQNKKNRIVQTRRESDAIFIFIRKQLSTYNLVLNDPNDENLSRYESDNQITMIFLKNKNPRDTKQNTIGDIIKSPPARKFVS